jgi:hypothetical protein
MSAQAAIRQVMDESPSTSPDQAKDRDGVLDAAKANNTPDNSDMKDGAAPKPAPRVGFKHDPDEERVLANLELDAPKSAKKRNKRRPKSQRGMV